VVEDQSDVLLDSPLVCDDVTVTCDERQKSHANNLRSVRQLEEPNLTGVLSFIESHLADDITIQELADIVCISRYHFFRRFKATMNVSPYAYITARRMERARTLLATTELSVEEIAERVGLLNVSHLRRQFRRYFGVGPSDARRPAPG
jgi:AraC family transcriptional regulator